MEVFRSSQDAAKAVVSGSVVAIGNFDGVHLGHQALFAHAGKLARQEGVPALALTFDPHPGRFFSPELAPPLITTEEQKLRQLERCGLDIVVVQRFDREFAKLKPDQFIREVLVRHLSARHVVVGQGFVFGRHRAGNLATLGTLGRECGFATHGHDLVRASGIPISSTKVREFVLMGRMRGAKALLGREFEVIGTVVTGAGKGRTIGIPTANLEPDTELIPGRGVYAGRAMVGGEFYPSVINVGTAPTVRTSTQMIIEAHLLDFSGDLVGERLSVTFTQRLRSEERFSSIEELVAAIQRDIDSARQILESAPLGSDPGE
jgi:riboflavin kinase/FMN adenylyltransferase